MNEEVNKPEKNLSSDNVGFSPVSDSELAAAKKKARFWVIVSGSCLLLALALVATCFWFFAAAGKSGGIIKLPGKTVQPVPENTAPDTSGYVRRVIDGVLVAPGRENFYPFAVAIDNHADARPQAGLAQANLVIEAEAEGGITRYLAFFASGDEIKEIGPVRSARPYFADWASEYSALYAHVGGSPDALAKMSKENILHINEFYNGAYFWRNSERTAPHNAMTSSDKMSQYLKEKNLTAGKFLGAKFKDDSPLPAASSTRIEVGYLIPAFRVAWDYASSTNSYVRSLGGQEHKTSAGESIVAKNVVIQYIKAKVLDDALRQEMQHIGTGAAVVCLDGSCTEGTWQKKDATARTRFYDKDNNEFAFNAGTTWIEVIEPGYEVKY